MEAEDIVGIRYQATTSDETGGIEDLAHTVVACIMHALVIAL
jgi:hypothetical protein